MWIWLWYVAHCSNAQINAQIEKLENLPEIYVLVEKLIIFFFVFSFLLLLCVSYFIFHIPSFKSLRKWAKHLYMQSRESIPNKSLQNIQNIYTQFFVVVIFGRDILRFVNMFACVHFTKEKTVEMWFIEFEIRFNPKWLQHFQRKHTWFSELSRNLTYFGHGSKPKQFHSTSFNK